MNTATLAETHELAATTVHASALLAISTSLVACGGGGGGGTAAPPATAPVASIAPNEAARFLLQAQFSASDAEISQVQAMGFSAWLSAQVNAPASTNGWDWQIAQGYNSSTTVNSVFPTDYMMWQQLIISSDAVRKRMALALSEIFVVSSTGVPITSRSLAMAQYWDTLVANALGNFRTLLGDITLNPAMGVYLNTKGNQKADPVAGRVPDENYSREVMQLFTLGLYELNLDGSLKLTGANPVETYGQNDVTQLARVFTGWDYDPTGSVAVTNPLSVKSPMRLTASLHETGASTFLGTTIAANTPGAAALTQALDALFNHANVAPFISKQLIQRLVTSNPSAAYVRRVAAVFTNNGSGVRGDLKAVLTAILLDAEARDSNQLSSPTWGKQREPMLRLVQWARTFSSTSSNGQWLVGDLSDPATRLGQSPLRAGSVFNFFRPGYVPPNTALATQSLTAPEFQLTNESSVAGYLNFMLSTIKNGFNAANGGLAAPAYSAELALVNDPTALLARLNLLLCAGQLSSATVSSITTAIASISTSTATGQINRVCAAVLLVMAAPEYLIQK